ncbi:MAG: hypothetical protein JO333_00590 [Verrucomicrobia bacterium]|nr:hypothetical protein [Verrucomicrobiota bacterium]
MEGLGYFPGAASSRPIALLTYEAAPLQGVGHFRGVLDDETRPRCILDVETRPHCILDA